MNERQFYRVLDDWSARAFDWRHANCCQFVADVVRCWGVDHEIPTCADDTEALDWLREQGCRSLYHYLVKLFGKPLAPLQARRGFIMYRKGLALSGSAIGTVDRKAIFVGERGLIQLPRADCAFAFDPARFRG